MSIKQLSVKLCAALAVTGLLAATPHAASAQAGVSLVPWAGAYIPTKNSFGDLDNAVTRDVSVIGGARLTFWGNGVLGFEARSTRPGTPTCWWRAAGCSWPSAR
jgi:hypothetical protein